MSCINQYNPPDIHFVTGGDLQQTNSPRKLPYVFNEN